MVTEWQVGEHVNLENISNGYRMTGRRICKPEEHISWLQDSR